MKVNTEKLPTARALQFRQSTTTSNNIRIISFTAVGVVLINPGSPSRQSDILPRARNKVNKEICNISFFQTQSAGIYDVPAST
jgi:hypothetical protein